jgi:hypothetical protein
LPDAQSLVLPRIYREGGQPYALYTDCPQRRRVAFGRSTHEHQRRETPKAQLKEKYAVTLAITSSFDLVEGAVLQIVDSPDLAAGATLKLRFNGDSIAPKSGRVTKIDDYNTGAVIDVEGEHWRLRRCTSIVHTGPQPVTSWTVVSRCEN